ncbi:hypothetical protein BH11MYX1_BH11MYX1_54890 [soil metagenome]
MKTKKPSSPTSTPNQLEGVDRIQDAALDDVVGGCGCGCAMPACKMPMAGGRTFGWR